MKKILKFIRGLLIFIIWTPLFIYLSNILLYYIWNFDFLSSNSWNILFSFWDHGGVIKTFSDILLISSLFLLPFICFFGFILSLKIKYLPLILKPIDYILSFFDEDKPERIVIKNLKSRDHYIEDIKNQIDSIKPQENQKSKDIRSEITQKLSQSIKK